MDDRVKQIACRLAMATPGPWRIEKEIEAEGCFIAKVGDLYVMPQYQHLADSDDDAELIANASEDIQFLLNEVLKYREALRDLFSVTPAQLTPEILNIVGMEEKHREAVEKAKRLLWGPANDDGRKTRRAAKRDA